MDYDDLDIQEAQTRVNQYLQELPDEPSPDQVYINCQLRPRGGPCTVLCIECLRFTWQQYHLCLRNLPSVQRRGSCSRCVPIRGFERTQSPVDPAWEEGRRDAIFILTSFYRPMPRCYVCSKFLEEGHECSDCDYDRELYTNNTRLQGETAIFDGADNPELTHAADRDEVWKPKPSTLGKLENRSLVAARISMKWFLEQLRLEREWAKLYPLALSPIAQSGINFIMKWPPFPVESGNMKTLINTNKFLNGIIRGQERRRKKQLLLCNPWPNPDNMPNLDLPQSTQLNPNLPSVFECPKENLREIFRSFYNQVFYIRAADIYAVKGRSHYGNIVYTLRMNPGNARLTSQVGCEVVFPETSPTTQSVFRVQVYEISHEAPNAVRNFGSLENRNMGQTPVPFLNPAELAARYVQNHPYWQQQSNSGSVRAPWQLVDFGTSNASEDPPREQLKMLAQVEFLRNGNEPQSPAAYNIVKGGNLQWGFQPTYLLISDPPQLLLHTHISPEPSFAPNFGNRLQASRTEPPGLTFWRMLQEAGGRQMDQQAQTVESRNTLTQFSQYSSGTTIITNPINLLPNIWQKTGQVSGNMGLSISLFTKFEADLSQSPRFQQEPSQKYRGSTETPGNSFTISKSEVATSATHYSYTDIVCLLRLFIPIRPISLYETHVYR